MELLKLFLVMIVTITYFSFYLVCAEMYANSTSTDENDEIDVPFGIKLFFVAVFAVAVYDVWITISIVNAISNFLLVEFGILALTLFYRWYLKLENNR